MNHRTRWAPSGCVPPATALWRWRRFVIHPGGLAAVLVAFALVTGPAVAAAITGDDGLQIIGALALPIAWSMIFSSIFHELGHALVARREGIDIDQFGLRFGGGYVRFRPSALGVTPRAWIRVLRAGPITNAAMAVALLLVGLIGYGLYSLAGIFFVLAATIEICIAVTNLLPVRGSDGMMIRQARAIARSPASI